jgi:hypothetical protein
VLHYGSQLPSEGERGREKKKIHKISPLALVLSQLNQVRMLSSFLKAYFDTEFREHLRASGKFLPCTQNVADSNYGQNTDYSGLSLRDFPHFLYVNAKEVLKFGHHIFSHSLFTLIPSALCSLNS